MKEGEDIIGYNKTYFEAQKVDAEKFIKNRCKEIYDNNGLSEIGRREIDRLRDKYLKNVKIELQRKEELINDILLEERREEKKQIIKEIRLREKICSIERKRKTLICNMLRK